MRKETAMMLCPMDDLALQCKEALRDTWDAIDAVVLNNQARVLAAFAANKISQNHMYPSTGYGYQDMGRDGLDALYKDVFESESALVRVHWASGTHVLKTVLFALLRPGDEVLSVTGRPYDTLLPVIGADKALPTSLSSYGVTYSETEALSLYQKGAIDESKMEHLLASAITPKTKVLMVQRSRGYSSRKTISMEVLARFMEIVKRRWPEIMTFVDNCYCEFVEAKEPPSLGVTLAAGSLIKNPGGGLAPTGGYVAGKSWAVDLAADTLYAAGIGNEVGSNAAGYRSLYQGLFMAPKVVGEALKGATFAAAYFHALGYPVDPLPQEPRSDIVQSITMGTGDDLRILTKAIQYASPVDSFATPEPWEMPGYDRPVIMAAGTFVQGSSIELSCDGPFVPPYRAYLQGGLTCEHVILACQNARRMLGK
jgi:cystathionine beta-lyase family protein involved in aluminum resistance